MMYVICIIGYLISYYLCAFINNFRINKWKWGRKMTNEAKEKWNGILALAIGVALIPALWAVLTPYIKINAGPVALISASIFFAYGGKVKPIKAALGYMMGLVAGILAVLMILNLPFSGDINLFLTLVVVPGVSVILALSVCSSFTDLSTWLGGMAITVLVMIMAMQAGMPGEISAWGNIILSLAVNMLAGVYVIGVLMMKLVGFIGKLLNKKRKIDRAIDVAR
jgi:hypothetical protein